MVLSRIRHYYKTSNMQEKNNTVMDSNRTPCKYTECVRIQERGDAGDMRVPRKERTGKVRAKVSRRVSVR